MDYPIKATFYKQIKSENDYNEVVSTNVLSFSTGTRPATVSFKDKLQGGQLAVSGDQQYLFARKNPNTLSVKVNDQLQLPARSDKFYRVTAIDQKLTDRKELMFLIDALDG